jgi:DME family drug/metabolite transporter
MPATSIGFWRVLIGTVALAVWGLFIRRDLFRTDRRGWLLVGLGGGALVALFEIAYQFAIAGAGVAGAAALLYTAPVIVAVLARVILREALTPVRIALALIVMAGVALTVTGGSNAGAEAARMGIVAGIAGGLLSALSYALTTLMARYAVPRYGVVRVLFLEALGGVVILAIALTAWGRPPAAPPSTAAWRYLLGLAAGSVLAANFLFFGAVKRIEAAPAAVAATIEPVVGALLALLLFSQHLTLLGWLGLTMVVGGVAAGYLKEGSEHQLDAQPEHARGAE